MQEGRSVRRRGRGALQAQRAGQRPPAYPAPGGQREEACPTLEQAKARLKELYPSKPDTTLISKRMAVNTAANRALAPEASKLLELETQVIHIDLGCCQATNGCSQTQNSPQSMRVWPGLRLIGAGGKIPKGVFVAVAEVEPDGVRLDNGMRLKNRSCCEPPGRATQ